MTGFTFNTVPSVVCAPGAIRRLGEIALARLGSRVAVVTDAGLVRAGVIEPALEALRRSGIAVAVYDGVVADPPEAVVAAAVEAAHTHEATAVVGLGGGSSMDVAKLVAVLSRSAEALRDMYGIGNVKGPRLPLLLAPTTAGTGSEVTPISIVTTGAHEKKGVVSSVLLPDVALLDPELTVGLPPHVTAATGVDAMVHAIEAYTSASPNNNPVSRALACEALRLLGRNIRRAVRHGSDLEARTNMLIGSMLAGQAFANAPVAAVHALAYPLGGRFHVPHGLSNALVLLPVLEFNLPVADRLYAELASVLCTRGSAAVHALAYPIGGHFGVPHGLSNALVLAHVMRFNAPVAFEAYCELAPHVFPELAGAAGERGAESFIEALAALSAEIGLEPRLRDLCIPADAVPMLAEDAMKQTRLLVNNPRPVSLEDARAIYEAAW